MPSGNAGGMGIRYYAYAFDAPLTERALADPHSILSADPLADAWGLEPGAAVSYTTFEQAVPERDLLYLDKAWRELQALTAPVSRGDAPRPAYRMFEGHVAMHGFGWDAWVRTLRPSDIPEIAADVAALERTETIRRGHAGGAAAAPDSEAAYVMSHLSAARRFTALLAEENRGMVYMIG